MNSLTVCPCCSSPMLHHIGNHREYWFCRNCWQEMPDLEVVLHQNPQKIVNLSVAFSHRSQRQLAPI